jgi:hypothetical protein
VKRKNADVVRRTLSGRRLAGACLVVASMLGGYALVTGDIGPAIRTDAASYQPGDRVDVRLRNGPRPAGYNLCFAFAVLQRQGAEGWAPVPAYLGPAAEGVVACTAEMRTLRPLGGREAAVHLPSDLPDGQYRLVHEVEIGGESRALATDPFTVGAVDRAPGTRER